MWFVNLCEMHYYMQKEKIYLYFPTYIHTYIHTYIRKKEIICNIFLHLINIHRYKRAVCHLILVDYICLPMYKLPVECEFLNATREEAVSAMKEGRHIPHKVKPS